MEAKLCMQCHDPEYVWKRSDKDHKCPIKSGGSRKSRYTCTERNCANHMWICTRHREQNTENLKNFQEEISRKYNLNFGYVVSGPFLSKINTAPSLVKEATSGLESPRRKAGVAEIDINPINSLVKEATSGLVSPRKKTVVAEIDTNQNPTLVKEAMSGLGSPRKRRENSRRKSKSMPQEKPDVLQTEETDKNPNKSVANSSTHQNLSTDQAMKKLRRKLSAGGFIDELRPIAKGRAQFMLGHSKGKTRGLLNLYDTGCGGVLFREGVPQHELAPAVLTTKGPFYVKGVGDTTVKVNDEFMCSMRLRDGTRQVLEGFTVDKITATLPFVNLATAESELKADKRENKELQELKCQPEVGGDCDILVGLMYSNIFPVAVHSLSNGLTIYKLKVAPQKAGMTALLVDPMKVSNTWQHSLVQ